MRISSGIVAILAALLSEAVHAGPIERIRPSDGIASIRINAYVLETHIEVTFSEDMIPLGGGHGSFPVKLEGRGQCDWGWRGPRTLSCFLGRDNYLPLAEKYALVINDGLTAVSGNSIPPFRLEFETDPPTASYASMDWDGPVSPVIYLHTNVPVSPRELQRRVVLEPIGSTGPAVRVAARLDPEPVEYVSPERQYAIKPVSALLADTPYAIRVKDGLEGIDSTLAGVAHDAGSFRTHAPFEFIGIGCGPDAAGPHWRSQNPQLIAANPDCAPEQPISLLFSAEPEIRGLYDTLTVAGLPPEIARTLGIQTYPYRSESDEFYNSAKVLYGIQLSGFPAGTVNSVSLPATVKDRFDRTLEPTTATFPTRNFVPAFLDPMTLRVVASGTGEALRYPTVNSDAVVAHFFRDQPPGMMILELYPRSSGVNERGEALLDVERILEKPWGALIGEVAVTQHAMQEKHALGISPLQYLTSVGAILSPWDIILAAKGLGLHQRHSIWVSSLETGEAVPDAKVELLQRSHDDEIDDSLLALAYTSGKVLGTARTDTDGLAEIFPSPATSKDVYPAMVRVTKGDVVVVLPIWEYQFVHRSDRRRSDRADGRLSRVAYLREGAIVTGGITDKPLYRGGETVRIKGYARARDDNRLVIPRETKPLKLSCTAYRNDLCAGKTVELDEYGSFDTTITLPAAAIDGEYRISVESETGGLAAMGFRVANYKPLPHRVLLELAGERVVGMDPIPLTATAQYFAGGPVMNAAAQVFVDARMDSSPAPEPLFEDYYFGRTHGYRGEGARSVSNARFDQTGRLTGSFPLPVDSPASGVMTVTVGAQHDGGEWAYSESVSIPYARALFLLGLEQKSDVIAPGETYDAGVVLVDLHNTRAEDLYVIQTLEYSTERYDGKTDAPMLEVDRCTVTVTPGKRASCELTPDRLGQAVIRARLMRGKEEIFQLARDVIVTLPGLPWYRESDTLDMAVHEGDLRAGQTAEISFDAPYDAASVLFSIHRISFLKQWREVLRKGKHTVRIPLTEKHAPGFTITAIARPTRSLAGTSIGSAIVRVQSDERVPTLIVESDKEDYKSGEQVNLTIRSTARGKTQLAVAVIDEGVLDLVPDADIFDPQSKGFTGLLKLWGSYQWWQLSRGMWTGDEPGSGPGELSIANRWESASAATTCDRVRAPGAHEVAQERLRQDFAEAAYFNPKVDTSDAGIAEINFDVPDNIGRWRVIVIGADKEGRLFANNAAFNVSLPLEVRANLPSRLVAGDSLQTDSSPTW